MCNSIYKLREKNIQPINFNSYSCFFLLHFRQYSSLGVDNYALNRSNSANNFMDENPVSSLVSDKLPCPQTLPSGPYDEQKTITHRLIHKPTTPPHLEDLSSHDSSDNVSLTSSTDTSERKRKKRLFPKIQLSRNKSPRSSLHI